MSASVRSAVVCGLTLLSGLGMPSPAAGQPAAEFPNLAALTTDEYVRAGADIRYYPFGRLHTGDVVKVIGRKAGWARVATAGPAFRDLFGYVRYPRTETALFRLAPDGRSGSAARPIDLFAPNLGAESDPGSSWKPIMRLPAGRSVQVVESVTFERDWVHKVRLPADAEGWIDQSRLRPATPAEAASWEAALARTDKPSAEASGQAVAPVLQQPLGSLKANVGAAVEQGEAAAAPTDIDSTPPPAPKQPRLSAERRLARIMLEDLEAAYARLLTEPVETAEVGELRALYLDLADRHPRSRSITRYAAVRARQLRLWAEVQQGRRELRHLRSEARKTVTSAKEARAVLESFDRYIAVGRLEASTLYDGKRLPKLLRVRDPQTGRTIAYLEPDEQIDLAQLIGRRVGIVGERSPDGGLRVNLIRPRRIDVLETDD